MLIKKMLREVKENFGQFFSIFILSALAVSLFVTLKCNYLGAWQAMEPFHMESNLADGWIYGENFSQENLKAVRSLDSVEDAQLRMAVTGSAPDQGGAEAELIMENENIVNRPYIMEGDEFDPEDKESVWLNERFADAWNLQIGDELNISYHGITFTKKIRGLIASPEYEYMCSSKDLEVDYHNIAYIYMSYGGFPAEEYILHLIDSKDMTAKDVAGYTDALNVLVDSKNIAVDDITQDMLRQFVKKMGEEQLLKMLPFTQMIITTKEKDVLSLEKEIASALDNNYAAFVDQSSIPGIKNFADELAQHRQFSYIFSLVFVLIAVLVIMTTMSRMVDNQRLQIGTMNALGMKRWKIAFHYVSYSFTVSALGGCVGLFIGIFGLGRWLVSFFSEYYTVPNWRPGYDSTYLVAVLAVVGACTAASYFSCRRILKIKPADSLRPASPKGGKRCVFERLPFWRKFGFSSQYNLRDISRSKLRAFMGVFGTACGMMLMVCGLGCNDTLNNIVEWNFGKLQNYSYEMVLDETMEISDADRLAQEYEGELIMAAGVEIARVPHAVSSEKSTCTLVVTEGKGYYGITDTNQAVVELDPGTVALTKKLAKKYNVSIGDTIYWHIYEENEWHKAKVGVINRNPGFTGITMLREDFEKTGCEYRPSSLYTDRNVGEYESKNVTAVYDSEAIQDAYMTSMQVMYIMLGVMLGFSALLIIVVLYNSGNLSFQERRKEFATLKVMGFQSKKIRSLLSLQNLWLSVAGLILGAPFGRSIMQYMFDSNGDNYDYQAVIYVPSYIMAGVLVLMISVSVSFFFSKRIKNLDMVDVLKGME